MKSLQNIYVGKNPIQVKDVKISASEQLIDDEIFFKISNLYIKDESNRFGLDSFKVLGGSYAVSQILKKNPNISVFCTATDGNHGKGLAWSAEKYNKKCIVFV